jgi:ABC-type sugar transport system ATPase subunit
MYEVRRATVRFGSTVALDDFSLKLEQGEAVTVRGPSGCGKTTLLRLIAGLTPPSEGEVWMDGALVSRPGRTERPHLRHLAFVFQEPRLWPHMTVRENVMFGLSETGGSERSLRLERVADSTGITDLLEHYPAELSGGQMRRVAVARALAPNRPLILMDEPLTNLDRQGRHDLGEVIRRYREEEGFALLWVTHDDAEEMTFPHRTIEISRGRLLSDDRPTPS